MVANNIAEPIDLFSSRGLRCTRQRRVLYDALAATKAHPTADQLYREVIHRCPGMSLATVYNTLEAFCRVGLALKLPGADGSAHYDATVKSHLHMIVESTGAVEDVPEGVSEAVLADIAPQLAREIEARLGFTIRQINVELVGDYHKP